MKINKLLIGGLLFALVGVAVAVVIDDTDKEETTVKLKKDGKITYKGDDGGEKEIDAEGLMVFDKKDGSATIIDADTGKPIPSCKERENTDDPCKYSKEDDENGKIKILKRQKLEIVHFVGSCCIYYDGDGVDGGGYEKCYPKKHPHPAVTCSDGTVSPAH